MGDKREAGRTPATSILIVGRDSTISRQKTQGSPDLKLIRPQKQAK
jgi:hypothetical protein